MTMRIEEGVPVLFTIKQTAAILNVSRSQVYVLINSGELGSVSVRGSRRISENQLIDYIRRLESAETLLADNTVGKDGKSFY